jgi:hypothetical protein
VLAPASAIFFSIGKADPFADNLTLPKGIELSEPDSGPSGARFEVWFTPEAGGGDRKLMESNWKIEGWMR